MSEPMYFCERLAGARMTPTPAAEKWMLIHGLRWGTGATGLLLIMNDTNDQHRPKHLDSYVIVISTDTIEGISAECRQKGLI